VEKAETLATSLQHPDLDGYKEMQDFIQEISAKCVNENHGAE